MRRWLVIGASVACIAGLAVALWPRAALDPVATAPADEVPPESDFEAVDVTTQSAQALALTGTVRDPKGNPVPNATVSLAASGQASLHSLKCGDCGRELLSCPARESGLKVASLLSARR